MSFLTRTYPFKQSKHWLRDSVLYGIVIWAILYLLQPFGFSAYQGNKCVAAAIFGLVLLCFLWMGSHWPFAATNKALAYMASCLCHYRTDTLYRCLQFPYGMHRLRYSLLSSVFPLVLVLDVYHRHLHYGCFHHHTVQ